MRFKNNCQFLPFTKKYILIYATINLSTNIKIFTVEYKALFKYNYINKIRNICSSDLNKKNILWGHFFDLNKIRKIKRSQPFYYMLKTDDIVVSLIYSMKNDKRLINYPYIHDLIPDQHFNLKKQNSIWNLS